MYGKVDKKKYDEDFKTPFITLFANGKTQSELSEILKAKFECYKKLAQKQSFSDDDYNELTDLENYWDEIPDFLALDIATNYRLIKFELEQREEYTENNG